MRLGSFITSLLVSAYVSVVLADDLFDNDSLTPHLGT
jgi:hypothetical protein